MQISIHMSGTAFNLIMPIWDTLVQRVGRAALPEIGKLMREEVRRLIRNAPYRTQMAADLRGAMRRVDLVNDVEVIRRDQDAYTVGPRSVLGNTILRFWNEGGIITMTRKRQRFLFQHGYPFNMSKVFVVWPYPMFMMTAESQATPGAFLLVRRLVTEIRRQLSTQRVPPVRVP